MDRIQADLKQLKLREIMQKSDYETLEMIFIESKRELDKRFMENKVIGGNISVEDARLFK